MNERDAYIALNMIQGIGPISVRAMVQALGSAAAIFEADRDQLLAVAGIGPELSKKIVAQRRSVAWEAELAAVEKLGAAVLTPVDDAYPKPLREIHDPPLALYVWGRLEERDRHAVAVVGSRRMTLYGQQTSERLAYQLAQAGFTVVSGLARGIDTAAHRGALKAKGRTLAVLGGALDRIYPEENTDLAKAIAESGAVLSEFPLGRDPDKTTFPMRNRIISGLSLGVLVVEAGVDSGAMITAREAADQGRTVFAIPGRIDSAGSKGCHRLIRDGARLVETVDDILEEFEMLIPRERSAAGAETPASRPAPTLSADEACLVELLRQEERMDMDALTRRSGLSPAAVSVAAIGLEMKRVARMMPGRILELAS